MEHSYIASKEIISKNILALNDLMDKFYNEALTEENRKWIARIITLGALENLRQLANFFVKYPLAIEADVKNSKKNKFHSPLQILSDMEIFLLRQFKFETFETDEDILKKQLEILFDPNLDIFEKMKRIYDLLNLNKKNVLKSADNENSDSPILLPKDINNNDLVRKINPSKNVSSHVVSFFTFLFGLLWVLFAIATVVFLAIGSPLFVPFLITAASLLALSVIYSSIVAPYCKTRVKYAEDSLGDDRNEYMIDLTTNLKDKQNFFPSIDPTNLKNQCNKLNKLIF